MGSDLQFAGAAFRHHHFNPRSRMGSDPDEGSSGLCRIYFNPRSRMGSDNKADHFLTKEASFQSTLPHGERQQKHEISSLFL